MRTEESKSEESRGAEEQSRGGHQRRRGAEQRSETKQQEHQRTKESGREKGDNSTRQKGPKKAGTAPTPDTRQENTHNDKTFKRTCIFVQF